MTFKTSVYEVQCNFVHIGDCLLTKQLPSAGIITINSTVMTDYAETIESCQRLLEDLCRQGAKDRFKIICEVNPKFGGTAVTKEWDNFELVRFWVHDSVAEGATDRNIVAVGKATVYGSFIGPEADA